MRFVIIPLQLTIMVYECMINFSFPLVCSRYVFFFFLFFFQILEKMKLENPTYESIVTKETSFSRQVSRESTSFNDDVWREVIFTLRLRSRAIKIGLLIRTRRKLKVRFTSVSTGALTRFSPRQWFSSRSLPRLIKSLFALTLREIDVFVKQFWLFPPC